MNVDLNDILSSLELWIVFLARHEQVELLKQAKITRMKFQSLREVFEQTGSFTEGQNKVLELSLKDYEYIQQAIFRINYEPPKNLH